MRKVFPWIITIAFMAFLVWSGLTYDGGCVPTAGQIAQNGWDLQDIRDMCGDND